jgi:hypothetical protein
VKPRKPAPDPCLPPVEDFEVLAVKHPTEVPDPEGRRLAL